MRSRTYLSLSLLFLFLFCQTSLAQELTFDIPEPETAALEKKRLWATYYHIWPATETPSGVALLDENNKRISGTISQHDWCRGAIEGTVLVTKADGSVQTYNYQDHLGAQQVDCSKVLGIDPIKKPWITATGKSRYRIARGTYGDGIPDYKLIPYRTIAVDEATIPYGSVVYIPQARGMTIKLPSGASAIHDGYFFAADKGGAIKGNHIDVFAGILTSNPFPNFVKSSAQHTFDAFIVRDMDIVDQLTALHSLASRVRTSRLEEVSTVRGSGWVKHSDSKSSQFRMLIGNPSATADGTDLLQVRFWTFEAKPRCISKQLGVYCGFRLSGGGYGSKTK